MKSQSNNIIGIFNKKISNSSSVMHFEKTLMTLILPRKHLQIENQHSPEDRPEVMRDNQEAISYEGWWPVKRGKWKSTTTKITVN